jgi:hypothetical protein
MNLLCYKSGIIRREACAKMQMTTLKGPCRSFLLRWVRSTVKKLSRETDSAGFEASAYTLAAKDVIGCALVAALIAQGKVWVTLLMDHKQAQRHVQYKNQICITICD